MKQITLKVDRSSALEAPSSGRLLTIWALYGVAMWLVSALTGPSVLGQAAAWLIALVVAAKMLACTAES